MYEVDAAGTLVAAAHRRAVTELQSMIFIDPAAFQADGCDLHPDDDVARLDSWVGPLDQLHPPRRGNGQYDVGIGHLDGSPCSHEGDGKQHFSNGRHRPWGGEWARGPVRDRPWHSIL